VTQHDQQKLLHSEQLYSGGSLLRQTSVIEYVPYIIQNCKYGNLVKIQLHNKNVTILNSV